MGNLEDAGGRSTRGAENSNAIAWIIRQLSVRRYAFVILGAILIFGEVGARLGLLPIFFPAPSIVITSLFDMLRSGQAATHLLVTLRRLLLGVGLGASLGLIIGVPMGRLEVVNRSLAPLFALIHPVPRVALLPLFIVVFGIGDMSAVMVIATAAFFPMLFNIITGIRQIDRTYFEVAHNYALTTPQIFYHVLIRGSMPSLLTGLRLSLNRGMVLAVAVELLTSDDGLGSLVDLAWRTLRIDDLYASLVLIGLVGLSLELIIAAFEARFTDWHADS